MNISAPVHPPADRHLAAGGGGAAGGDGRLPQLPVAPLPRVDFPTIQVQATLPGASPETMASAVATPLERRFGRIAGLTEMTSVSSARRRRRSPCSSTSIATSTGAARDVQAAINAAGGELPANLPTRPNYRKVNPADAPILILALTSRDAAAGADLRRRQQRAGPEDRAGRGGGAGLRRRRAAAGGARAGRSRRCWPGWTCRSRTCAPRWRRRRPTSPRERSRARRPATTWPRPISCSGADAYRNLIVAYQNGAGVRLGDVAKVIDDVENNRVAAWMDGKRAVLLIVRRQPGRQHPRDHRRHQGGAAAPEAVDLAGHRPDAGDGPHHHHPRSRCTTSS